MSGTSARRKGAQFERDIVIAAKARGLEARRTAINQTQDGSATFGDVAIAGLKVECKHHASIPFWGKLVASYEAQHPVPYEYVNGNTQLARWLAGHDALIVHQTRSSYIFVLTPDRTICTLEQWLNSLGGKLN
jgi:hypothetical protein